MAENLSEVAPKNVVILTSGLSGSSVLAGLVARAGYWLGDTTKKVGYETFENAELVDLDREILRRSGFLHEDAGDLPPPSIAAIEAVVREGDSGRFRHFIESCSEHEPWLWKDPRLCYTIHFWQKLHDFSDCRFILATRESRQAWTGFVLRGKVNMPWERYLEIQENDQKSAERFIERNGIRPHTVAFEDLILHPERVLDELNSFLGTHLSMTDFEAIYRGKVGRLRWTHGDFLRARAKVAIAGLVGRGVTFPQTPPVTPAAHRPS